MASPGTLDCQSPLEHREWASKHTEVRIHITDAQSLEDDLEFSRSSPKWPGRVHTLGHAEFAGRSSANAATQTELTSINVAADGSPLLPSTRTGTAESFTTTHVQTFAHPANVSRGSSSSSSFRAIAKEMETRPYVENVRGQDGKDLQQQPEKFNAISSPEMPPVEGFPSEGAMQGKGSSVDDDSDEKVCRVCQLSLSQGNDAMELGCACKEDLALVHRHCAEAWFKIRGNRTCEICGKSVENLPELDSMSVRGPRTSARDASRSAMPSLTVNSDLRWWQQQPVRNFLLACAVIAFMLPWLFRFFSS